MKVKMRMELEMGRRWVGEVGMEVDMRSRWK